jgi:type II secretory pathway predicted ATPase ExeA
MTAAAPAIELTEPQHAALAKIAASIARPGGVAVLCGPLGTGTSTVLAAVAAAMRLHARTVECRDLSEWEAALGSGGGELPDVVIADEAHVATPGGLARLLAACRSRGPAASLVLAGEGRLLTLISRDSRVEQAIQLRASLRPCSSAESCQLLAASALAAAVDGGSFEPVAAAIHEIAAGIPAAMLRLAELACVVAASRGDRTLRARDIEAIHRRLSPLAA